MKLEFPEAPTKHLLRRIWRASERTRTFYDADYGGIEDPEEIEAFLADPDGERDGLPCLFLHGTPFGIYLSGNCKLHDGDEIFAIQANPNAHPDRTWLAGQVEDFFEGCDNPFIVHIMEDPFYQKGVVFERFENGISATFLLEDAVLEELRRAHGASDPSPELNDEDPEEDELEDYD
jgi:hypothetical protein